MKSFFISISFTLIIVLLSACNTHRGDPPITDAQPATKTIESAQDYESVNCAFMWAKNPLPELSENFDQTLKETLPNAEGYAEAYGENCVTEAGEIARFLAMETDYHVTFIVDDLEDKQTLGKLVEAVMEVLAKFPTDDTPGPQPGYIGITFEAPNGSLRLWIMRTDVEAALDNGLYGEELFIALQNK
jgi:hypothetical protein